MKSNKPRPREVRVQKHQTVREAIEELDRVGAAWDPIEYRGGGTTPTHLKKILPPDTLASSVQIGYWGRDNWAKGTLADMVRCRKKPSPPPAEE